MCKINTTLIHDLLTWNRDYQCVDVDLPFFYRDYFDRAADEYMFIKFIVLYNTLKLLNMGSYFLFFIWHLVLYEF